MYETIAYRAYIQGKQNRPTEAKPTPHFLDDCFKGAHSFFAEQLGNEVTIIGWDKARRFNTAFCIKIGSTLETEFVENFRRPFSHYGAHVACDEKVFQFNSNQSGMLRVIPAKHQKGLWNTTMAVTLQSGLPYLIDSVCATEITDMDEHTTMISIFEHQVKILREKPFDRETFSCGTWDSYYGTNEALQYLRRVQQPFIWAINAQRFGPIVSLLTDYVRQSGQMAFAVRDKDFGRQRPEVMSCFWSKDSKKGKRYTITNYLKSVDHKRRKGYIPGFMEYEETFASCDKFNRRLHDKSWPCKYAKSAYSVEVQSGHDFLFTAALVNMHHLWKTLDWKNRKLMSFQMFTQNLALEILANNFNEL